ncbi:exodeoxyribonuclease III [Alsobacter sp. SYSU BS001988]
MGLKVATWNINSVRLRSGLVTQFLQDHAPDVLCLQETKCPDDRFPLGEFRKLGYNHIAIHGQKGYHGVAIVSRLPFEERGSKVFCGKNDARHIAVTVKDAKDATGVTIHNFYVPAGGDIPDPEVNEKFAHKLSFLDEMRDWCRQDRPGAERAIVVGDLNVAPLENDVWSHKQMRDVVSHTAVECEKLLGVQDCGDWVDAIRTLTPEPERVYTWWSYRAKEWELSNRGRRLDHMWVSKGLAGSLKSSAILREARSWERPSDHVPVMIDLEF